MQIIVKSRHTVLPKRIKTIATEKFEKVGKLLDRIQTLEVAFGEEHNPRIPDRHHVEVTLVTKNTRLHATASGPDPMSAVDKVISKVEAQIRKVKGKAIDRTHRAPSTGQIAADSAMPLTMEEVQAASRKKPAKRPAKKPSAKKATRRAVPKKPAGKADLPAKKVAAAAKPRKRAGS